MDLTKKLAAIAISCALSASISQSLAQNNDTTVTISKNQLKMIEVLKLVAQCYMDSIPEKEITEMGIRGLLGNLDPHTRYYTPEEAAGEQNRTSCKNIGTGITCRIFRDTVIVVAVEPNSPAYRAGIKPGQKLDSIGRHAVSQRHLQQADINRIMDSQTGDSTSVALMLRKGTRHVMIGIDNSTPSGILASYAPNDSSVYVRISKFCKDTDLMFRKVLKSYPKKRLRNIILDLRDNPGGLYQASINISNMFVKENVRTSKSIYRNSGQYYYPDHDGELSGSRLYVLINENTASASEVIASCVQDSDQGVIIGRRSYGKGISQQVYKMSDGSMIRISNARLISPTGRCIQKEYGMVQKEYFSETAHRRSTGENLSASKMPAPSDTTVYRTLRKGRKVFAGMGVVPDVFVAEDTTTYPACWQEWIDNGLLYDFAYFYTYIHRSDINKEYRNFKAFKKYFHVTKEMLECFAEFSKKDSRSGNMAGQCLKMPVNAAQQQKVVRLITAVFAQTIYGANEHQEIINQDDNDFLTALKLINTPSMYYEIL